MCAIAAGAVTLSNAVPTISRRCRGLASIVAFLMAPKSALTRDGGLGAPHDDPDQRWVPRQHRPEQRVEIFLGRLAGVVVVVVVTDALMWRCRVVAAGDGGTLQIEVKVGNVRVALEVGHGPAEPLPSIGAAPLLVVVVVAAALQPQHERRLLHWLVPRVECYQHENVTWIRKACAGSDVNPRNMMCRVGVSLRVAVIGPGRRQRYAQRRRRSMSVDARTATQLLRPSFGCCCARLLLLLRRVGVRVAEADGEADAGKKRKV
jgi:hypothetical protein